MLQLRALATNFITSLKAIRPKIDTEQELDHHEVTTYTTPLLPFIKPRLPDRTGAPAGALQKSIGTRLLRPARARRQDYHWNFIPTSCRDPKDAF